MDAPAYARDEAKIYIVYTYGSTDGIGADRGDDRENRGVGSRRDEGGCPLSLSLALALSGQMDGMKQ